MVGVSVMGLKFETTAGSSRLWRGNTTALFQESGTVSETMLLFIILRSVLPMVLMKCTYSTNEINK